MTLTLEYDVDGVNLNQRATYPTRRRLRPKLLCGRTGRHTHRADCSTCPTKRQQIDMRYISLVTYESVENSSGGVVGGASQLPSNGLPQKPLTTQNTEKEQVATSI